MPNLRCSWSQAHAKQVSVTQHSYGHAAYRLQMANRPNSERDNVGGQIGSESKSVRTLDPCLLDLRLFSANDSLAVAGQLHLSS